jgi:hypothetical protein
MRSSVTSGRYAPDPLLRIFRDDFGREWEVRMIADRPSQPAATASANPALMLGALLFDSGEARRRLEPLPPGWYVASEALLTRWCESAIPLA